MATPTEVTSRFERSLGAVLAEVHDLPNVESAWTSWDDAERAAWSLDWDHLMADYLTELEEFYRANHLNADQQGRYLTLLGELKQVLPIIERLGIYPPHVPLQTTASPRAGSAA